MDRITTNLFDDFVRHHGLSHLEPDAAFERFANYSILSHELQETFNLEDVTCGRGGDTGIDGIAMIVNGALVTEEEEVTDLASKNRSVQSRFIFVQAKQSAAFEGHEMGNFFYGVADFFREPPRLTRNAMVQDRASLAAHVFRHAGQMTRGLPTLAMYYVTTGKWVEDQNLKGRIDTAKEDLRQQNLFSTIDVIPVDATALQTLYRKTSNTLNASFVFDNVQVLPAMPGVSEAFLGVVAAPQFLRLIKDADTGTLIRSAFYDNVRDYQGLNAVNSEVGQTLQTEAKHRFAILNNGITVVAKDVVRVSNTFTISDYQIVNGCQTSHMLFAYRELLDDNVRVPLKLITVDSDEVTNQVIRATNRQTEVKERQLFALSTFQKQLELYFETFAGNRRLYYERRSKQYARSTEIEKNRIIPIQQVMRAYAACFLKLPHKSHYVRSLDELVDDCLFIEGHKFEPYYASALAAFKLESHFRTFDTDLKPGRFHILMAATLLSFTGPLPRPNSNAIARGSELLMQILWDEERCTELFVRAAGAVRRAAGAAPLDRARAKRETFTTEVLQEIRGE